MRASRLPRFATTCCSPVPGRSSRPTQRLAPLVTEQLLRGVVELAPLEWMGDGAPEMYVRYLTRRLEAPRLFAEEAEEARTRGG